MLALKEKKIHLPRKDLISWIIFLPTLIFLLFSLIPAIFPAFLLTTFGGRENISGINPFEMGVFAVPLLVTNFVILGIGVLHYKNRLWNYSKKQSRRKRR